MCYLDLFHARKDYTNFFHYFSSKLPVRTARVGYDAGLNEDVLKNFPITPNGQSPLCRATLLGPNEHQFRLFLSMAKFKPVTKDALWKKPAFFFGDNLETNESDMHEVVSLWVREVDS